MEVAISIPGVNFERQLKDKEFLYSDISESQFKTFKKNKTCFLKNEKKILMELSEIKRKKKMIGGLNYNFLTIITKSL